MKFIKRIFILMLVLFILSGCQPTPAKKTVTTDNANIQQNAPLVPSKFEKSESKGHVTFNCDATINIPQYNELDSYYMQVKPFTQEEIDSIISMFIGNEQIYDYDSIDPFSNLTKNELEKAILDYGARIAGESDLSEKQRLTMFKEELEKRYKDAPDSIEMVESDGRLKTDSDDRSVSNSYLDILTNPNSEGNYVRLTVDDNNFEYSILDYIESMDNNYSYKFRYGRAIDDKNNQDYESAKQIADDFVGLFKEDHLVLSDSYFVPYSADQSIGYLDIKKEGYAFIYKECFNNVFITDMIMAERVVDNEAEELAYTPPPKGLYSPEEIQVVVSNNRIEYINWMARSHLIKKADENVSIMNFDDMVELAEQNFFKTKYGTKDDPYSATITEIKLAYAKMPVQNDLNTCQVVPIWDFIGSESYKEADEAKADHNNSNFDAYLPTSAPEEFSEYLEIAREYDSTIIDIYSILRINAITGDYIHNN